MYSPFEGSSLVLIFARQHTLAIRHPQFNAPRFKWTHMATDPFDLESLIHLEQTSAPPLYVKKPPI